MVTSSKMLKTHFICFFLQVYLTLGSKWAVGALSFAVFGIVVTTAVLIVFVRHNDTPVVRYDHLKHYFFLVGGRVSPGPPNFWNNKNKCVFNKRTIKVCVSWS